MLKILTSSVVMLVASGSATAGLHMILQDDYDDVGIIGFAEEIREHKDVVQFRRKLYDFKKKLYPLKEHHFIALFGKSQAQPKTYAMPVAQDRMILLSGLRSADPNENKQHHEFYVIDKIGALGVWYNGGGVSPEDVVFYFLADKDFPKLTNDNLAKRLAWDEDHLKKLVAHFEKRMIEVFPWEVDQMELAKLHEGDFSIDAKTKLEAWIESGTKFGYRYEHAEGSNHWFWYRANGKLARSASRGAKDGPPRWFVWHHEDGNSEARSEEIFHSRNGELLISRNWYQPSSKIRIRHDSTNSWYWYEKNGKGVRTEWDDNGDGIPDWYMTDEENVQNAFYKDDKTNRKPLKLEDSWAINPKLIPEESRISDQPDLRVPIRRKVAAEPVNK
jgi:hypothetical protein